MRALPGWRPVINFKTAKVCSPSILKLTGLAGWRSRSLLLHSRQGSGEYRSVEINVLVEESLNLAYHGARAENPEFKVTLQRDFDPGAGEIEVFRRKLPEHCSI